jgi:methylenetetrahydrofolate dehydrogenase (NADP+)/methenyltetrahydrofolate cyclohydrolase/formyltetrahydrofolate synthetase
VSKDASQEEVEKLVRELEHRPKVNGILVQLPLPDHLDEEKVLNSISIEGCGQLHPINIRRLAQKGRESLFVPTRRMAASTWWSRPASA